MSLAAAFLMAIITVVHCKGLAKGNVFLPILIKFTSIMLMRRRQKHYAASPVCDEQMLKAFLSNIWE